LQKAARGMAAKEIDTRRQQRANAEHDRVANVLAKRSLAR
jgi:hypothetical protein